MNQIKIYKTNPLTFIYTMNPLRLFTLDDNPQFGGNPMLCYSKNIHFRYFTPLVIHTDDDKSHKYQKIPYKRFKNFRHKRTYKIKQPRNRGCHN